MTTDCCLHMRRCVHFVVPRAELRAQAPGISWTCCQCTTLLRWAAAAGVAASRALLTRMRLGDSVENWCRRVPAGRLWSSHAAWSL